MDEKPVITSWGRYIKQAKVLIKELGLEEMKRLCDNYFEMFEDKYVEDNKWSLGVFLTDRVLNKLREI